MTYFIRAEGTCTVRGKIQASNISIALNLARAIKGHSVYVSTSGAAYPPTTARAIAARFTMKPPGLT